MVDFKKILENQRMAKKNTADSFDDDFGTPVGESGFSGDMPDTGDMPTEEVSKPNWLKPVHVGRSTSGKLNVVRVLPENTQFSDIVLLVSIEKREFRLGMKLFSDDYKSLKKLFGPKRENWHGEVRYKVIANNGKPYIAVRG